MGLNAYEYQCGRGVRINREGVLKLKAGCEARDIQLSLHAPYYISLSSVEEEKRQNSIKYILESAEAADLMGARRIVVHSGSCAKISREEALSLAGETLKQALAALDEAHLGHIIVCPEVMGKFNQLGTLEEVMELCKLDDRLLPCIDFGHLNARTLGSIRGAEDYEHILLTMKNEIGEQRHEVLPFPFFSDRVHRKRRGKTPPHLCRYHLRPLLCAVGRGAGQVRQPAHHHL